MNLFISIRQISILLFSLFFISNAKAQTDCKEVIGYYPGWQWYDRDKLVNPETIDYSKYTIINYAFLYPLTDGTLTITDPWSDKNILLGNFDWATSPPGYDSSYDLGNPEYHIPNTSLVYHAHANDTKVMISIGGWTLSNDFPAIAADPTKRTNLAHWCNELIRVYDIDGIDIDWEYPGYAPHGGTDADVYNYTLLLQEIRDSLTAIEPIVSKDLLLTAAFSADPAKMDDVEWNNIVTILDYINLMSYDFFGAFSAETNHNSPLYAPASGDPTFNANSAIQTLITEYNVPDSMLNLGIAFYGRSAKTVGVPNLHVATTGGVDATTFSIDEGNPQYYNILDKLDLFTEEWDELAKVPYLNGDGDLYTFLSYDNEKSIGLKAQYIVDNNLAGAIIWEITGDYLETSPGSGIIAGTPLADTLNRTLCHELTGGGEEEDDTGIDNGNNTATISIFPNPAKTDLYFKTEDNVQITNISIRNTLGKTILKIDQITDKNIRIDLLPKGLYIIEFRIDSKIYTHKFLKE